MKENCWEVMQCGREPGGIKAASLGVCPATLEEGLDEIHGGKNAGRACWVVAGTYCEGEIQGTFAAKFGFCEKCDFYVRVQKEEFPRFVLSSTLVKALKKSETPVNRNEK
jgi:hypothetical protein